MSTNVYLVKFILSLKIDSQDSECQFSQELKSWIAIEDSLGQAKNSLKIYQDAANSNNYSYLTIFDLRADLGSLQRTAAGISLKPNLSSDLYQFLNNVNNAPSQVIVDLDKSVKYVPVERQVIENGIPTVVTSYVQVLINHSETAGDVEALSNQLKIYTTESDQHIDYLTSEDSFSDMLGRCISEFLKEV